MFHLEDWYSQSARARLSPRGSSSDTSTLNFKQIWEAWMPFLAKHRIPADDQ
jgi:hypothetical protein